MAARAATAALPVVPGLPAAYARWRHSRLGSITDALEARLLFELLGPAGGLHVLDAGCGDGALAVALARRGARVTGLDADAGAIAAAGVRAEAARLPLGLAVGRAEALPFADATFDRVVAVTVLCFVRAPDRAIGEMARVLKPGGRLVIGELGRFSLWAAARRLRGWLGAPVWQSARFHTADALRGMVERHGLVVHDTRGSIFYPPAGIAASLMAPIDPWLGRRLSAGAAFIAVSAGKPAPRATAP